MNNSSSSQTMKKESQQQQDGQASVSASSALPHACIITSKKRMVESQMIFGIYCEV